ncbi:MAG TPA: iron-containing alcohol dehydrogenase [Candidatus Kapabacteria bacterium]|nr:iron-containing alcohol dehydrogenase [Candidatus Kapabacteria bacterium]
MDFATLSVNWNYPTAIKFGAGRIKELAQHCANLGMTRPLFVTDPGMVNLPMTQQVISMLHTESMPCEIFSNCQGNPTGKNVEDGVEVYKQQGCDGVIAFGGGSALDVAKAIAFMSVQTRPLWDFEDIGDNYLRATTDGLPPVIGVPTTAGTGSEVGRASVITNEATHTKCIIFHPRMLPNLVISDPELSQGLPPHITAATGMDALAHCLEAYCSPMFHPMAEGVAVEGMRLIKKYLPIATADGANIEARAAMLAAASMGAAAFQKGLGAIHSLSHPVGAVYNTHHGLTNAVFMPYVLVYNRAHVEEKMERLAGYLELPTPGFDGVLEWILELRRELKIPHALPELGVDNSRFEELSVMAFNDPSTGGNPRTLTAKDMRVMFEMSHEGRLTERANSSLESSSHGNSTLEPA